jgi:hypothetical protein
MLTSSPQIDFVLRGIGWEDIHPRSLQQLQDIHLAAGVPVENVTVVVPKDGVYAVMEIRVGDEKPHGQFLSLWERVRVRGNRPQSDLNFGFPIMIPHENRNRTPHTSNVWSRSGNPPSAPPITFYRKAILRRCARYCSTRICQTSRS